MLFVQEALYTQQCCKYWEEENGTETGDLHVSARERNTQIRLISTIKKIKLDWIES